MAAIADAYQRFCIKRFPLPSEAQLAALEGRSRVRFPRDYRQFVLDFNGGYFNCPEITPVGEGCPMEELESLFGFGATHPTTELAADASLAFFDDDFQRVVALPKRIPIGRTAVGGLIILDTAPGDGNGEIYLKQAWGEFYWIAADLEVFFGLLREPAQA